MDNFTPLHISKNLIYSPLRNLDFSNLCIISSPWSLLADTHFWHLGTVYRDCCFILGFMVVYTVSFNWGRHSEVWSAAGLGRGTVPGVVDRRILQFKLPVPTTKGRRIFSYLMVKTLESLRRRRRN